MKVVHVSAYYPPHIGGMENCVKKITEGLAKNGNCVSVYTSNIGYNTKEIQPKNNFTVNYLKSWEFAHSAIIPSLFIKLLKIDKDSIIHVHVAQVFIPEIVFLVSKIRKIPYIAHVHADVSPSGKLGFLLPFYKDRFLKYFLRSATKIIVPTKDYVILLNKKYNIQINKILVIPNGICLSDYKSSNSKLHSPTRLLCIGSLTRVKNIPFLVELVETIKNKYKLNTELHIVGDGDEKSKIVRLINKLNLKKSIILHSWQTGRKLQKIYSKSDIFVSASINESFGIVLLEAMASGKPIVASNILGFRRIIKNKETGFLVKITQECFSKAISKLIKNQKIKNNIVKNGLKEVEKYDWKNIIPKYEKVYKEVLNENN